MRADETIKFRMWLTGHDEETIRQMLKDWGGQEIDETPIDREMRYGIKQLKWKCIYRS